MYMFVACAYMRIYVYLNHFHGICIPTPPSLSQKSIVIRNDCDVEFIAFDGESGTTNIVQRTNADILDASSTKI